VPLQENANCSVFHHYLAQLSFMSSLNHEGMDTGIAENRLWPEQVNFKFSCEISSFKLSLPCTNFFGASSILSLTSELR
jgi:hypothetical protein